MDAMNEFTKRANEYKQKFAQTPNGANVNLVLYAKIVCDLKSTQGFPTNTDPKKLIIYGIRLFACRFLEENEIVFFKSNNL